jgi:formylglycine-generating enzyme required for sulfatase activity
MHGNVWEWVHDWWKEYPTISQTDPKGPITGEKKIIRGGSASNDPSYIRSAKRAITFPYSRWEVNIGFRISFQK